MWQTKFMLFGVIALTVVNSAVAIIGGRDATPGQFPYFVLLETYKTTDTPRTIQQNCGGALISNQWIVTNARCLVVSDGAEVHLGVQNLDDRKECGRQIFNVTKQNFHIHPKYRAGQPFIDDIALIKLPSPVKFSKYIQSIKLSDSIASIAISKDVTTMGYGLKNLIVDGIPENLQYTNFKITELHKCAPNALKLIRKNGLICGIVVQGRLCHGDMGGPLVSPDTGELVGLAISSTWHDCEVSRWQSFIGIAAYKNWIEGIIYVGSHTKTSPNSYGVYEALSIIKG